MALCFPFMKYIFLLTLFVICFTLMFSKNLEFLGLVLFFVVNVMYSAMIGMDVSAFLSQILGGNVAGQNWVLLIAFIIIVVLVLNFTSSVLTIMTLGNLYYKFGAKGNPILLSPEYRLELNNIKGLFVSIIVLITVLTLRIFLSPDQMSYGVFEWMKVIPDEVSKYGHLIMSIIAFALLTTIFHIITPENQTIDELKVPNFPSGFKYHFTNLFYVLMSIVLLYFVPAAIGFVGLGFGITKLFIEPNGIYEWFVNKSNFPIPAFDVFILIVSLFTLLVSSKLRYNENTTGTYTPLSNIGIVFSVFLFVWRALCELLTFTDESIKFSVSNFGITIISFILLFTLSGVSADPENTSSLNNKVFELLDLTNTTESYVLSKVLVTLLMLFPLVSFIMMIKAYFTGCTNADIYNKTSKISKFMDIMSCIFTSMSTSFTLSMVEVFNIIKGILIILAFVFSGLTINEYSKHIAGTDKYNMYNSIFNFNVTFIFAMIFLMVVLVTSFFNTDNFPLLLAMSVEYLAPVIILVMASYLVYYANDLAKLSKKEVLNDVQKEKKRQRELPDIEDTNAPVATSKTYDGTTHKI
jgi:hypothetical protein